MARRRFCLKCGMQVSNRNRSGYCDQCRKKIRKKEAEEKALSHFADVEMFGEDEAEYFESAGLEFGNK